MSTSNDVSLEFLLKNSLEVSPDCYCVIKQDIICYCNENFAHVYGSSKDDVIGNDYRAMLKHAWKSKKGIVINTDDFAKWIDDVEQMHQQTISKFEVALWDGRWFQMTRTTLAKDYEVLIGSEITQLKKTQQALQESVEHIKRLANTDQLTGISNRRAFETIAQHEIAIAMRYSQSLSLLILDIDYFKRINDTYGHESGDDTLKAFAEFCSNVIRESDTLCRIGGEEFAVLLPMTKLSDACTLAERLREGIARYPFYLQSQDKDIPVTVSIGVSKLIKTDKSINDVVARADTALYEAKTNGRNMVCSSTEILDAM